MLETQLQVDLYLEDRTLYKIKLPNPLCLKKNVCQVPIFFVCGAYKKEYLKFHSFFEQEGSYCQVATWQYKTPCSIT